LPLFYFYRFPDAKPVPRAELGKKRPKLRKNGNFRRKKAKNVAFFSIIFSK
jgi:hypothetical protein